METDLSVGIVTVRIFKMEDSRFEYGKRVHEYIHDNKLSIIEYVKNKLLKAIFNKKEISILDITKIVKDKKKWTSFIPRANNYKIYMKNGDIHNATHCQEHKTWRDMIDWLKPNEQLVCWLKGFRAGDYLIEEMQSSNLLLFEITNVEHGESTSDQSFLTVKPINYFNRRLIK